MENELMKVLKLACLLTASPYFKEPKRMTPEEKKHILHSGCVKFAVKCDIHATSYKSICTLTDEGVACDEEGHSHDDEEALVHRDEHRLHQHLQRRVLPGYGAEPVGVQCKLPLT